MQGSGIKFNQIPPALQAIGGLGALKSLKGRVYPSSYFLPGAQNLPGRIECVDLFRLFEKNDLTTLVQNEGRDSRPSVLFLGRFFSTSGTPFSSNAPCQQPCLQPFSGNAPCQQPCLPLFLYPWAAIRSFLRSFVRLLLAFIRSFLRLLRAFVRSFVRFVRSCVRAFVRSLRAFVQGWCGNAKR